MALLKGVKSAERKKKVHRVSSNPDLVSKFKGWNGKSLSEVDEQEKKLVDIHIGKAEYDGNLIINLVMEFPEAMYAFPLSRGFDATEVDESPETLLDGEFYFTKKAGEPNPETGEPTYDGDPYISFGKPSGLDLELSSLINAEVTSTKED